MSETKFTKGEWKFNAHDGSITDATPSETGIAQVFTEDWHHLGMGYANAYLIAAAPEMYAMLESLIGAYEDLYFQTYGDPIDKDEMKDEYQLLAKARGEL